MATQKSDVLAQLGSFRSTFSSGLVSSTAMPESHADRTAAQEGLQLIWSFSVADLRDGDELDDQRWELLRDAFPDEFFEPEPDETFMALSEKVPVSYAEQWKFFPSDHLCDMMRGCMSGGDAAPVANYAASALNLGALTIGSVAPITARGVFDIARYESMLKRARILTEVGVSEAALPQNDQIKTFCMRSSEGSSLSFGFIVTVDEDLAADMIGVFARHHGRETTDGLLASVAVDHIDPAGATRIDHLRQMLATADLS